MTAHHPWLKHSPNKVRGRLDAVSFEAAGLWHAVQMYLADIGGDGTILVSRLSLATGRRVSQARCLKLLDELVAEGLADRPTASTAGVLPWEQPDVDVWEDPIKRARWARRQQLKRDGELCRRIQERDRNLCRYCGLRVNWNDKRSKISATYDHVDPDGPNSFDNVVVSCRGCNGRKRDRTPEQAGMPLLRPGQSAGAAAASAAQRRSPERSETEDDPVPIQVGTESDPVHGPSPPCAPAQDRTEPNRNWFGSDSGQTAEGPGIGAHAHENVGDGRDG